MALLFVVVHALCNLTSKLSHGSFNVAAVKSGIFSCHPVALFLPLQLVTYFNVFSALVYFTELFLY